MSRQQRQVDELRRLCAAGSVARAIDLAHQHCADFGRDEEVLAALREAISAFGASEEVRERCARLAARDR